MKSVRIIVLFLFCTTVLHSIQAQSTNLSFNTKGEFKIMVLSDLHLDSANYEEVISNAYKLIGIEKPNFIVLNGDNVSDSHSRKLIEKLGAMLGSAKTPWVSLLGNHDDESWPIRNDLVKFYMDQPYNLNRAYAAVSDLNFSIPIKNRANELESVVYLFNNAPDADLPGKKEVFQDVILYDQVEWFRKQSSRYTQQHNNVPLNAIAFTHIALPEFRLMWEENKKSCVGNKLDEIALQPYNFGLFASFYEMGDVMGLFVSHDHKNNFVGTYKNIALGYANFSGSIKGSYSLSLSGARVIVLKEGHREFHSWIRTNDGKQILDFNYKDARLTAPTKE